MEGNKFQANKQNILEAQARLKAFIRETPLLQSSFHSELHLKAESLQVTGSFKVRAAFNQILLLSEERRRQGLVTSSSGNFAQAAAYAAKQLGLSAKIVMMKSAHPLKVERTKAWGAEVVPCEDRFEARDQKVAEIERGEGRTVIYPYDHPDAVYGNATAALEIFSQFPGASHLVVPVSGGGLIAGIALAAKLASKSIQVWGVQPAGSNAAYLSFQAGRPVSIDRAETMADGLTATKPGSLTFPLIQAYVDHVVTVGEETILQAVRHHFYEEKLVVEPSGAVPMAAVLEGKVPLEKTVLVLSGGNLHPEYLREPSST
ncbi:MAG: threonine ammonia-lyase [Acidobacteriota bacterium]